MNLISKKDILIFIIILLFAFTITYPLIIQMHFAPDTYQVVVLGYKEYAKQFKKWKNNNCRILFHCR